MCAKHVMQSKNGRLTATIEANVPAALLQLLFDDDSLQTRRQKPSMDGVLCATSIGGRYVALAHKDRFMLLGHPEHTLSDYRLISVGNDATSPEETVTALYCMDIYTSAQKKYLRHNRTEKQDSQSLCIMVGYSSGYVRVFSLYGHLLTAHQFHSQPLLRIRLRMPSQTNNSVRSAQKVHYNSGTVSQTNSASDDAEEVSLTYEDGTIVNVDGRSLYLALRLCLTEATTDEASEPTFQYKKWSFDLSTPSISDAVSYGPATCKDPLSSLAKSTMTSSPLLSDATAGFIVAPQYGEAAFGVFITNEDAAATFSAVDIAGKVAAKVTGAVLNIAKSYLWRNNPLTSSSGSNYSGGNISQDSMGKQGSGTLVPCAMAICDSPRKVLHISLAPAQYNLAALVDSLGRVMLFDTESCEVVQMLKGFRGCQCAWLEVEYRVENANNTAPDSARIMRKTFVVIYASKRGVLELYELGTMNQPYASISIGLGWNLVQCPTQPLGGSLLIGNQGSERRATSPGLADCILLDSSGRMAEIKVEI
ncbi:hypothetical protein COEREDRAFT_85269 [Coemansia reversa NRRL 1564]|uniref:Rab3-GAP regulatory subunit N-terminal domain-containing protein n=1 Tax=Coemansia reversa (strain ATCC 12441 / NRRL 1564) TaxID=763665 RepID=A0A2G5BGY2_COERN|nr:hypothetical protein COEREDRAFT_85269 [Coemansia reversa NRRL 1564]|eukprot:PIA18280.1 hypothetical protein COEREDRAFT_85269 [Coemansia reversa NRRL 1564]